MTAVQKGTVSDAGKDNNGECIEQLWDCQLLKKDFVASSLIRNIFKERCFEWTDNQACNLQEHICNRCAGQHLNTFIAWISPGSVCSSVSPTSWCYLMNLKPESRVTCLSLAEADCTIFYTYRPRICILKIHNLLFIYILQFNDKRYWDENRR